jgi:hypothetical protein
LLEVLPGQFTCPDLSLLYRVLSEGIYWLLVEAFGASAGQFQSLFGYVFQEYTDWLWRHSTYVGNELARTFYARPKFVGTTDEVCDGLLHWAHTAVLMEYKAGLLTTRQKYAGIAKELFKGVDDMLIRHKKKGSKTEKKGVGQLADSLSRVLRGERMKSADVNAPIGPDLSQCKLLPTLVTYDESLGLHAIQHRAQRALKKALEASGVSTDRIGPVLVLTIEDIETIQDLQSSVSIEAILLDYADYLEENPYDNVGSFQGFVYAKYPSFERSFLVNKAQEFLEETLDELRKRQSP